VPGGTDAGPDSSGCPLTECAGACTNTMGDARNCGFCGHDCLGAVCDNGRCYPAGLSPAQSPVRLAVDATSVYWTAGGSQTVSRAPKSGGTAKTDLATGIPAPFDIAVDASFAYFTSEGTVANSFHDGSVARISLAGGVDAGPPVLIASARSRPQALAIDATSIYWVEVATGSSDGTLESCLLAGCGASPPKVLASNLSSPYAIALDAANVYVSNTNAGVVAKVSKLGGNLSPLAEGQNLPNGIAVLGTNVYWATYGDGLVQSMPTLGGMLTTVALPQGDPQAVAVDESFVYFTNANPPAAGGAIEKCPLAGCAPDQRLVLVGPDQAVTAVALDASYVYFAGTAGLIQRVAK
jgi:hypothetical protein